MSESIKFNKYIDSSGVTHNNKQLKTVLNKKPVVGGWQIATYIHGWGLVFQVPCCNTEVYSNFSISGTPHLYNEQIGWIDLPSTIGSGGWQVANRGTYVEFVLTTETFGTLVTIGRSAPCITDIGIVFS